MIKNTPPPTPSAFPSTFFLPILPTILAGILVSASVDGLRFVCELGFDGESFLMPGRVRERGLLVLEKASAEKFDRNQEDDRRSAKKALQP